MAGYCGFSKSNNAVAAEASGLLPASQIARVLGVKSGAVKSILSPKEWHHTSKFYNTTDYYSLEEAQERLNELKSWSDVKTFKVYENCSGSYLEWGGTRRHPRAFKHEFKNVRAEQKGKWFYLHIDNKIVKKGEATRGFHLYDERGYPITCNRN